MPNEVLSQMKRLFLCASLFMYTGSSFGAQLIWPAISVIGSYQPVLLVEKSQNPENKLVVFTKLNENCDFVTDSSAQPIFDFFWLMSGTTYKALNSSIKTEIKKRIEMSQPELLFRNRSFFVSLNDLKEVDHDIKDPRLVVAVNAQDESCTVESRIQLGPSSQNAWVKVESFYGETTGFFRPKIVLVKIKGINIATGAPITQIYKAKK